MLTGLVLSISICILLVILLRSFFVVAIVKQESMTPTFKDGDAVLVIRRWPTRWLRKGQIVLIQPPCSLPSPEPFEVIPFIKRIVGLPGDSIPNVGRYPLNNHQLNWPSCVPPGHFFVQGDHMNSVDSRTWGAISISNFLGLVIMKIPYHVYGIEVPE